MARVFPRKDILQLLHSILSGISTVYTSNRPPSVKESMSDFIVVDLVGSMNDYQAYQDASLRIDLFKKDNGVYADEVGLDALYGKVISLFPIVNKDLKLRIISPKLVSGGGDDKGFHYLILYSTIIIE